MRRSAIFDHFILGAGVLMMCGPLVALFLTTTHGPEVVARDGLQLLPGSDFLTNYSDLLNTGIGFKQDVTALTLMWNSFVLGTGFALTKVAFSLLAAYGLAYFRLPFSGLIFWVLLLSLMLPLESRFLPTYLTVSELGLVNTKAGLILPLAASGVGTFFFRQFLRNIPDTLVEAARIDGAGPFRFLRDILIPISLPMAGALFLVTFVNGWNQYLWPVMVTSQESGYTLVRGLQFFGRTSLTGMSLAVLAVLPPLILVVVLQKRFVKGLFDGVH